MARLRSLEFEAFPAEIRLKIYRMLLTQPGKVDPRCTRELHSNILRSNKKIHGEGAVVLYGENFFIWQCRGRCQENIWHSLPYGEYNDREVRLGRHYSSLMTKVSLEIYLRPFSTYSFDQAFMDVFSQLWANVAEASRTLALNDLKILEVNYTSEVGPYLAIRGRDSPPGGTQFVGDCLLPLANVRADQFILSGHASSTLGARLKAAIEGPKDAAYFANRQHEQEKPEIK